MTKPLKKWQIRLITDPIKPCACGTAIHKRGVDKCKRCRKNAKSEKKYKAKIRNRKNKKEREMNEVKMISRFASESRNSLGRDPYRL